MARLFEPFSFLPGPTMKNRFMLVPMTNLQSNADSTLSNEECRRLVVRAEAGYRLTMTCAASVEAGGPGFPGNLGAYSDRYTEGLSRLAAIITQAGGVAALRLYHAGSRSKQTLTGLTPPGRDSARPRYQRGRRDNSQGAAPADKPPIRIAARGEAQAGAALVRSQLGRNTGHGMCPRPRDGMPATKGRGERAGIDRLRRDRRRLASHRRSVTADAPTRPRCSRPTGRKVIHLAGCPGGDCVRISRTLARVDYPICGMKHPTNGGSRASDWLVSAGRQHRLESIRIWSIRF